jgi:serine/threonine-protein kinase
VCAAVGWRTATADPVAGSTADAVTAAAAAAARAAHPDPPPGYDLLDRIGAGGMGLVYQARERATDRLVAVKYIHAVTHPTARDRFRLEVQALARVQHPHIVQVFAVSLDGREPYFTMEHLPGGTLSRKLTAGPLAPAAAARLVAALAGGVHAAHAAGVLHRDLKPANVLLDEKGEPKVTDFGLAKWVDRDDGLTGPGSLIGTPSYMAPEHAAREHAAIGPRSDVYSLGAILYECLTGRPPFKGPDPATTAQLVVSQQPVAPRSARPGVPPDLEAVCLKCLEKNPADRYPSAAALADDLDRFARGETTAARPPAWHRRAWRRARRHWRWAAAAAALLAAGGVGAAVRPRPPDPVPPPDPVVAPDPWAAQARDLDAGGRVTIVPAAGFPAAYESPVGPAVPLAGSPAGDGTCGFQTHGLAVVTLVRDPRTDRYRVSADLRHLGADNISAYVGVFVGLEDVPAPGPAVARWLGFDYSEAWNAAERARPGLKPKHALHATAFLAHRNDRDPDAPRMGMAGAFRFDPRPDPPPWRTLAVEATPDGLDVFWTRPDGTEARAFRLTAADLAEYAQTQYATYGPRFWPNAPAPAVRPWDPRRPLGVYAFKSSVAVRNVTLQPLPPP